jgi:hypothetical protein
MKRLGILQDRFIETLTGVVVCRTPKRHSRIVLLMRTDLRFFIFQFLSLLLVCEAKRKSRSRDVRSRTKSFTEFGVIILVVISALVLPLLFHFIYKIVNDPATPNVIQYYWKNFKQNGFGYLGREAEGTRGKSKRRVNKSQ